MTACCSRNKSPLLNSNDYKSICAIYVIGIKRQKLITCKCYHRHLCCPRSINLFSVACDLRVKQGFKNDRIVPSSIISIFLSPLQQWGAVTVYSNPQKYTFVIPFNEMCFYCGGIPWKIASGAYCGVAYTVSKIEFEMYYYYAGGATDVCWIAIGV